MRYEDDLKDAKYIVFIDYCDSCIRGFKTFEEAKAELDSMETDYGCGGELDHYLVKVVERKTIDHDKEETIEHRIFVNEKEEE